MSFLMRMIPTVFVTGCLVCLALPVFASGTCAVTCRVGTATPTIPPLVIAASGPVCAARCPTACPAGATCSTPVYVDGATLPVVTPPTPTPHATAPAAPPPTNANRAAVPITLSQPIGGVRVVVDVGNYIAVVYSYIIGLASAAAVIMIVYGGFLYLLGSAMSDVSKGKQIIQDAIIGLLLVLGSYMILATVNPNTLSLKLPNIQTIVPKALPPPPSSDVVYTPTSTTAVTGVYEDVDTSVSCTTSNAQDVRGSCTFCLPQFCVDYAQRLHKTGTWTCDPTRPIRCSSDSHNCVVRCANIDTNPAIVARIQQAAREPLARCALDRDAFGCPAGQTCMRTEITVNSTGVLLVARDRAARQGYCSDGRDGSRCHCSAQGCNLTESGILIDGRLATLFPDRTDVNVVRALQPTNNGWIGSQPCQDGLRCVLEGTDWFCRPAAGAVTAPTP